MDIPKIKIVQKINFEKKTVKSEGKKNAKNSEPCKPWRCTHTHTHTSTFKEIRRVANGAALFGDENRLFVALYEGKNKVLEIACFSCRRKFFPVGEIFVQQDYADCKEFLCNCNCLEILAMCFLRGILLKSILKKRYTELMNVSNLTELGGVE